MTNSHNTTKPVPRAADETSPRKLYQPPKLVEYGTVAKLTQSGGATVRDGFAMRRMSCL